MIIPLQWGFGQQEALRKGNIDPKKIDLIIYIGEEHKEYPLWTAAIKMQEEIGAYHAWGFDVAQRCGTTIMAMKVAKSLMEADDSIKTVLFAGGIGMAISSIIQMNEHDLCLT